MSILTPEMVQEGLRSLPTGTSRVRRSSATTSSPRLPAAMVFVNQVAEKAETADHHPDIDIRYNKGAAGADIARPGRAYPARYEDGAGSGVAWVEPFGKSLESAEKQCSGAVAFHGPTKQLAEKSQTLAEQVSRPSVPEVCSLEFRDA